MGNTWERYEGNWATNRAVDTPAAPAAGTWGYLWREDLGDPGSKTLDPDGGTRDGSLDDRCYRISGRVLAVRATRADGSEISTGHPQVGFATLAWCDTECGALPEPFPTGFLNRMVS